MKKQAFGISIVSVVIIGIGSLLSSCDFRMSVKDRTGETQEYTAESAAAENTLPLEVVKYQQLERFTYGPTGGRYWPTWTLFQTCSRAKTPQRISPHPAGS